MCKIGEVGDLELTSAYEKLCVDGRLKDEHKHVAEKGLTHALDFPRVFKIDWIKIVLSQVHDMKLWLERESTKITRKIIQRVTGYLVMDKVKTI